MRPPRGHVVAGLRHRTASSTMPLGKYFTFMREKSDDHIKRSLASSRECRILYVFSSFLVVISLSLLSSSSLSPSMLSLNKVMSSPASVPAPLRVEARRFPKFGSPDFFKTCSWTTPPVTEASNCTILVRPGQRAHEGMAQWISNVVTNYIDSRVRKCKLLVDYGPNVNLSQVLLPHFNWLAPRDFECLKEHACERGATLSIADRIPNIPFYRGVYSDISTNRLKRTQYRDLEQTLSGFHVENGMSCSLAALFDLAPSVSQYEPELFTRLLPSLRDSTALVMTVYIRTGLTDQMVREERNVSAAKNSIATIEMQRQTAKLSINCALQVEKEYLSSNRVFSRVVWMVVTDSLRLKREIIEEYSSENVLVESDAISNNTRIPRIVLTTRARGKHTRTARKPSTDDFVEAFIDWYLIGESNVVVSDRTVKSSFETTASLRTNRPIYIVPAIRWKDKEPKECTKREWLHD